MNNQNETPFGSPRFLGALAITFLGLWGWQYYVSKNYPQANAVQKADIVTDKPAEKQSQPAAVDSGKSPTVSTVATDSSQNDFSKETIEKYEDSNVSFEISSIGMGIKNYTLKKYTDREGNNIVFSSDSLQSETLVNRQRINFSIKKMSDFEFIGTASFSDKNIKKVLKFNRDKGYFDVKVEFDSGLESIQSTLYQKHYIPKNTNFLMPSFEVQDFIFIENGKTHAENISHLKPEDNFVKTAMAPTLTSVATQYFTVAAVNKSEVIPQITNKVSQGMAFVDINYDLRNLKTNTLEQIVFLGPKESERLVSIDTTLPEVMNYGMFGAIAKVLLKIMVSLHDLLGNWGLAIIALTLIVRTILLPFNVISFRSAQAMQKLKPKMDSIRERYKDDPIRMNKETMAVMKDNNANPLMGCLPMLLQIPIFFALWKTIGSSIEIYQQPFFGWITDLSHHDPFFVFPVLMGITMYLQQKLTPTTMDPTQAKIMNFMPILFTMFMLTLPSGLTLYNFISSLFGVIQQYFLLKENKSKSTQLA